MKLFKFTILLAAVAAMAASNALAATINEIRIDDASGDTDEYFELVGTPGESLDGLFYVVIGDGSGGSGVLERVIDLAGLSIQSDGYFLAANSGLGTDIAAGAGATIDLTLSSNTFENSDNVTHLLVSGLTAAQGDDLDIGDTGTLATPWTSVIDGVSFLEGAGELLYASQFGLPTLGPDGTFVPAHLYRFPNAVGDWRIGSFGGANDTPGFANPVPEPSSAFIALGACFAGMIGMRRFLG